MAEEITLKVNVETGKAVTNLGNLEKATKGVTQATKQADAGAETLEQQFDSLNKEIKEGPVNIRRMNKQIQEYQAIALEAGRTSPLGKKAIQEAAQLKDRYNDITAEVNRLANDGVKMQAALDIGTTVIAGYAAFQGALAIAGVDSEKYRETLIKLQGAQSLLMGIETLRKNLEKESTVVLMAKNAQEKASIVITKLKTFVTNGATSATKLLRIAMLSLPFVAIGAAIIALVSHFKSIMKTFGFFNEEADALKQTMDAFKAGAAEATKKVMEMDVSFKLAKKGVIDKKEALDKYNKEFGKTLGVAKDYNEAEEIFIKKTDAYIKSVALRKQADALLTLAAEKQVEALTASMQSNLTNLDKAGAAFEVVTKGVIGMVISGDKVAGDLAAKEKQRTEERVKAAEKESELYENLAGDLLMQAAENDKAFQIISEGSTDFQENQGKKRKEILARQKKAYADLVIAMIQARAEDEKDAEKQSILLQLIEKKKFEEQLRLNKMTKQELALATFEYEQRIDKIREDFAQKEIDRQISLKVQETEILNELYQSVEALENAHLDRMTEDQKRNQEIEINAIYDKYNAQIEALKARGESTKLLEEAQGADIAEIKKKYTAQEIADAQAVKDAKIQASIDSIGAIMDLTSAFAKDNEKSQKRAFEINKKLQIAQALIQTYQGVQAIFAAKAASPETILFPAAPFIAAGIALATGLANVQNIRKQKFSGGAAGGSFGGGGVPGGGGGAPQIDPVTNTSTLVPQEDQKVYVTETDISDTQNKVSVIEAQSTF